MTSYSIDDKLELKQGDPVRINFREKSPVIPGKIVGKNIIGNREFWIVDVGQPLKSIDPNLDYPFNCVTIPTCFILNENI
jgi:hypothetical protein